LCAGESYVKDELPRAGKSELQRTLLAGSFTTTQPAIDPARTSNDKSSEAAGHTLKSMGSLLQGPLDDPGIVVAETQVMIQGREAMGLARPLHFVKLRNVKSVVFNHSPIMRSGIHGEAGRCRHVFSFS
jgi:hypothetical protein